MRCSLLALSSYINTELDAEPAGELEAHLVACDRCRTAIGHLREESERIGSLARVHVPDDAVHELFSQIGLIAEEDELPEGPVHRDRPAPGRGSAMVRRGAGRGIAVGSASDGTRTGAAPRAGRRAFAGRDRCGPRSSCSGTKPSTRLRPQSRSRRRCMCCRLRSRRCLPRSSPSRLRDEPYPVVYLDTEPSDPDPAVIEPQPPQVTASEPQPPDLSTSAPMVAPPRLAAGTNTFQRLRDAVAVRFALRRRGDADYDSGVEIVSGIGAPRWDQRARPRHWNDSPSDRDGLGARARVLPDATRHDRSRPPAIACTGGQDAISCRRQTESLQQVHGTHHRGPAGR